MAQAVSCRWFIYGVTPGLVLGAVNAAGKLYGTEVIKVTKSKYGRLMS